MPKSTIINAKVNTNDGEKIAIIKKDASTLEAQSNLLEGLKISEELFDELLDLNRELSLLKLSEED